MARAMRVMVAVLLVVPAGVILAASSGGQTGCDPSYPGQCIPSPPPNLNCDSPQVQFSNFPVREPDPHDFDRDGDGVGCETSTRPRFVATTTTAATATTTTTPAPTTTGVPQSTTTTLATRPALDRTG